MGADQFIAATLDGTDMIAGSSVHFFGIATGIIMFVNTAFGTFLATFVGASGSRYALGITAVFVVAMVAVVLYGNAVAFFTAHMGTGFFAIFVMLMNALDDRITIIRMFVGTRLSLCHRNIATFLGMLRVVVTQAVRRYGKCPDGQAGQQDT